MSREIIPLFSTSASRKEGGIFTVEKAGDRAKQKRTKGPVSLCDLAVKEKMSRLYLVGSNLIDFFQAHKNLKAVNCQLVYGLKVIVCENLADKSEASLKTESKVIIWMAGDGSTDYRRLINLYTVAANDGFYYVPRLDWKTLCAGWGDDLLLSLPFYSSFLAKNTLTFSTIVPELPVGVTPLVLREVAQELPFDDLIDDAVDRYVQTMGAQVQQVKSVYYRNRADAKQWLIWRCILDRGSTWDVPKFDWMCSDAFSFEHYKELTGHIPATQPVPVLTEPTPVVAPVAPVVPKSGPAIYVDELFECESKEAQAKRVGARNGHQWCHMWCEVGDEENLHALAARVGMKRAWFQPKAGFPHYDLVPSKRARAIELGATPRPLMDWLRERRAKEATV